jgi:BCD family chlorophyll transporter-like MFS transporter
LLLCVAGVVVAPHIAFRIAEDFWSGAALGAIAFGAWGMGYNFATVSYFSLATELSGEQGRTRTIAVMFFMMIVSIIATSIVMSRLLEVYSPFTLQQAFLYVGLVALALGVAGLFKLEPRHVAEPASGDDHHSWRTLFATVTGNPQATLFLAYLIVLLTAILGQDILLEPFGAESFGMPVDRTTIITAVWGIFFLISLAAGGPLEKRVSKFQQARIGAVVGIFAFGLIALSGFIGTLPVFWAGVVLLGFATGLSTVSNLSLMLDMTVEGSVGLFMGVWGMATAVSRLVGNIMSGVVRDTVSEVSRLPVSGYLVVFVIEIILLLVSLQLLANVDVRVFHSAAASRPRTIIERAALAEET